jgi:hypothetical protein
LKEVVEMKLLDDLDDALYSFKVYINANGVSYGGGDPLLL